MAKKNYWQIITQWKFISMIRVKLFVHYFKLGRSLSEYQPAALANLGGAYLSRFL